MMKNTIYCGFLRLEKLVYASLTKKHKNFGKKLAKCLTPLYNMNKIKQLLLCIISSGFLLRRSYFA